MDWNCFSWNRISRSEVGVGNGVELLFLELNCHLRGLKLEAELEWNCFSWN